MAPISKSKKKQFNKYADGEAGSPSCYGLLDLLTIIIIFLTFGCAGPPMAMDVNLIPNPNPNVPLVGILTFTSDRPVVPSLYITDGKNEQRVTPDDEPRTNHEILVLGLRPDRMHEVIVTISDERGHESVLDTLQISTPPLPDDFPPIEVSQVQSESMEPGITTLSIYRWDVPYMPNIEWGLVMAVDQLGDVLWYFRTPFLPTELRRMKNGNLFLMGHRDGRLWEIDMLGNIVKEWHSAGVILEELTKESIPVETDYFHHDVIELPSGNLMALGVEVQNMDNFPIEYPPSTKRQNANVVADVILEFERNGNTVRKWPITDILDPRRLGEGSFTNFMYALIYAKYDPLPFDITHSNALYYIEEQDALIISSKHQCAIYKIDMVSGELLWILGDPIGWDKPWSEKLLQPKGDITWPCHQHGLEMTPSGNLLLYDNGAERAIPPQEPMPEEERYSRAVEYRIDETTGTVEEVWSYDLDQEHFMSPFVCDADYLPETGNILITDGGRISGPDGELVTELIKGKKWARVFEVTYEDKKKVWELIMKHPETGFSIYRAQRLHSLYPKLDHSTG